MNVALRRTVTLPEAVQALERHYGPPSRPPATDPFELVLLENVAYLATPKCRLEAFELLRSAIGTTPKAILAANHKALERVTSLGILKGTFAEKLRACAEIALDELGGDLGAAIRGPLESAKRALRLFPGIGEPGAEKILLFAGRHPFLAPDSNGLRVLGRLGLIREEKSYARTYAAGRQAGDSLPAEIEVLQKAHLLLQQHGQTLCRRTAPLCEECPLEPACAYAAASAGAPGKRLRPTARRGILRRRGRGDD
jgi:endonuclease III